MTNWPKCFFFIIIISSLLSGCSQENPHQLTPSIDNFHNSEQLARVAIDTDPLSLDPRLVRDLETINFLNTLFEGLMSTGPDHSAEFGLAKSVDISSDLQTYTFTLRDSTWSDGSPLTAEDFAETWKSTLDPAFPSPNAHMLYVIKGAKEAKEGTGTLDAVGIRAASPEILIVELEKPASYFLKLLTGHFFFPVHSTMRKQSNISLETSTSKLVGNGPFTLARWKQRNEIIVTKNPRYWNAEAIALDGIHFQILDDNTALQLFKAGKLDWAGSSMSTLPQDALVSLKESGNLKITPAAGTHWVRFNTRKAPFDNTNLRKAFNLALDRKAIVEHITQGNQLPAMGVTPPSLNAGKQQYYKDKDTLAAQKYYMSALIDLKNSGENLPEISLCYSSNDRNRKIAQAIQQQWHKTFGISIALESCETQVFYDRLRNGNYQLSLGSWYADTLDPINFLEIFKTKEVPTNNTFWENAQFAKLLDMSSLETSIEERNQLLSEAEAVLMDELPIAPLFHGSFNYLVNPRLNGVVLLESGLLNFKNGSITTHSYTPE